MATSGSVDFNLDMAEITEEAFERCGLELRTGYDAITARRSLNLLFADWANRGLNLWTIEQITQTLAQLSTSSAVATYPIGVITMTVGDSSSFSVGETITGGTSEIVQCRYYNSHGRSKFNGCSGHGRYPRSSDS